MMENNLRNATLNTDATSSQSEGEKSPVPNQPIVRNTDDAAEPYLESAISVELLDVHIPTGKAILGSVAGVETNATVVLEFPADLRFLLEENESTRVNGGWFNSFLSFRCKAAQDRQIQRPRPHHPSISWDADNLSTAAMSLEEEFLAKNEGTCDALGSSSRMPIVETSACYVRQDTQNPRQRFGRLLPKSLIRKKWKKHRIAIDSPQDSTDKQPAIQLPKPPFAASTSSATKEKPSSFTLSSSRKQITRERRAQLGFARTIAMDGILESFSEVNSQPKLESAVLGRTKETLSPYLRVKQGTPAKKIPGLDCVQIRKEGSSPRSVSDFEDCQVNASYRPVWV
ncbi:hypothetical protein IV203_020676 [Nitzschia inconspicua]|uniref:Uncharacterized protein n=1 Tax=Nitzschia inconspicua TaxID=303405 RepID=A0A9K3KG56_9STRA|nr:hypothetical protein IV203_020670 [Nitzschia inconspicua]KAG7342732.1 hypothetical protein IV203_020676 [Nitzschia inconspicua]